MLHTFAGPSVRSLTMTVAGQMIEGTMSVQVSPKIVELALALSLADARHIEQGSAGGDGREIQPQDRRKPGGTPSSYLNTARRPERDLALS